MASQDYNPTAGYPMVMWLVRSQKAALITGTLLPVIAGTALAMTRGSPAWLVAGIALGAISFVACKVALEVLTLVTDLLIPR